jgi:hypothetical protein
MKRLDQDHLHLKLEIPRLTCPGLETNPASAVGGEHSRMEPFEHHMLLLFRNSTICIITNFLFTEIRLIVMSMYYVLKALTKIL